MVYAPAAKSRVHNTWRRNGLCLRARAARPFVPPITSTLSSMILEGPASSRYSASEGSWGTGIRAYHCWPERPLPTRRFKYFVSSILAPKTGTQFLSRCMLKLLIIQG